jgi:hypothetical protein
VDGNGLRFFSDSTIAPVAAWLAATIRIGAVVASGEAFGGKWCESMTAFGGFFDGTIPESYSVCHCPSRVEIPGELVRINWNPKHLPARLLELSDLVRLEIEPFIIGVGNVVVENIPEGGVIVRRQDREEFGGVKHGDA